MHGGPFERVAEVVGPQGGQVPEQHDDTGARVELACASLAGEHRRVEAAARVVDQLDQGAQHGAQLGIARHHDDPLDAARGAGGRDRVDRHRPDQPLPGCVGQRPGEARLAVGRRLDRHHDDPAWEDRVAH